MTHLKDNSGVESPAEKKPHCENMVYEAVEAVEGILAARGIDV